MELTADFFARHYPGGDLAGVGLHYESYRQQTGELVELVKNTLPRHFQAAAENNL